MTQRKDFEILRDIEASAGKVTPAAVVKAAAKRGHPWHSRFEWDDTEAATRFRLSQARDLIRSVRYEVHTTTETLSAVAYVRDPSSPGDVQGYVSVASLLTDKERAREAVLNEFGRVVQALRRARDLAAVLGVDQKVADMIMQAESLTAIVAATSTRRVVASRPPH